MDTTTQFPDDWTIDEKENRIHIKALSIHETCQS